MGFPAVTPEMLARARREPAFRRQLAIDSLNELISVMARLKGGSEVASGPLAIQLREGADLAVKLSDYIKRLPAPSAQPPEAA